MIYTIINMQDDVTLFHELDGYYKENPDKLEILKDVINGTNYWTVKEMEKSILFTVGLYVPYKEQIEKYSRKCFSPFRRHHKLTYDDAKTSIGQLNFFKWVFENDVIKF